MKHTLRQEQSHSNNNVGMRFFYFCIKGVAGFVIPTQIVKPKLSFHYLNTQNLDFRYIVKTDADCAVNIPLLYAILQHPSLANKEYLYIGDCFRSTFSNSKKKHYVPRKIISDDPVVKSVARGGLYVLSSNIIPYLLIGVRHLSFLTHQEDLTVGRSLNNMGFSCMNVYSKWISRYGCVKNIYYCIEGYQNFFDQGDINCPRALYRRLGPEGIFMSPEVEK